MKVLTTATISVVLDRILHVLYVYLLHEPIAHDYIN